MGLLVTVMEQPESRMMGTSLDVMELILVSIEWASRCEDNSTMNRLEELIDLDVVHNVGPKWARMISSHDWQLKEVWKI